MEPWKLLLLAVGAAAFLEGLPYFVSPPATRRYMLQLVELGDGSLRLAGFALIVVGLLLAYLSLH